MRSLPRRVAAAAIAVRSPSAPPYQQAATPMPPQAKPGRDRYQPCPPTGSAAVPENRTATLVTVRRPRATQPSGGSTVTVGSRRLTRYSCRPSGPCAVTSALSSSPASEHHGLTPVSVTGPPRPPGPSGPPEAVSRCGAASAANTPQVPSGGGAPASARIASASECASSTRRRSGSARTPRPAPPTGRRSARRRAAAAACRTAGPDPGRSRRPHRPPGCWSPAGPPSRAGPGPSLSTSAETKHAFYPVRGT